LSQLTSGGRNAATGKFFFGTRKCSVCSELKSTDDFDPEEADESAAKRCCKKCSRAIVEAIQSLEAKTPVAPPVSAKPVGLFPDPEEPKEQQQPEHIVIGRTHRVYGPDKSSFGERLARRGAQNWAVRSDDATSDYPGPETVTCGCGCGESASASMWYQGDL